MTQFHCDQFMFFEIDEVSVEFFGDDQSVRNLAWEGRLPAPLERFWRSILAHHPHGIRSRDGFGIRKSLEKCRDAKPVIAVTMGDVDRFEIPASCGNPIGQRIRLRDGHERIHQDGVPHPVDKGRRHRLKVCLSHVRRLVARDDGNARRHEYFPI